MTTKEIDFHLANFKEVQLNADAAGLTDLQRIQIKNTIMCAAWAKAGPVVMFIFRSLIVRKLRPKWALVAEGLNTTFNGLCEIPQQSSSS